jgi:hypothetical protein
MIHSTEVGCRGLGLWGPLLIHKTTGFYQIHLFKIKQRLRKEMGRRERARGDATLACIQQCSSMPRSLLAIQFQQSEKHGLAYRESVVMLLVCLSLVVVVGLLVVHDELLLLLLRLLFSLILTQFAI